MDNLTKEEKRERWDYILSVATLDGGSPSEDMLHWIEEEINGKITTADILELLNKKYKKN